MRRADRERSFRYLIDENVTRSCVNVLRDAGREAVESRDAVGPQAADKVLEWLAFTEDFVLVSRDRDFRSIIKGVQRKGMRRSATTVWLRVAEAKEAERILQCLSMVEDVMAHAIDRDLDIEYIQVLEEEINVKYRLPPLSSNQAEGQTT